MEIKEERAKIWRNDYKGKDGKEFYRYAVGISKKTQDGEWVNTSLPVMFSKKSGAPEKIENGTVCSIEGFMSVDSWTDKEGRQRNTPMIIVMKALFDNDPEDMGDSFEQAEVEIPF